MALQSNECYVEDGYWASGYTVCDDCSGGQPKPGGGSPAINFNEARRRNAAKKAFEARELEWSEDLTRIIDEAFADKAPEARIEGKKPTKRVRKQIARRVYDNVKRQNLSYKLAQISRLIDDFAALTLQNALDKKRRQNEDALILLLFEV